MAGYRVSRLDGMIVQHGGVYVGQPDSGNLPDPSNRTGGRGGGIYIRTSGPIVENNTVRHNSIGSPYTVLLPLAEGAGIACFIAHPTITANTITENENLLPPGHGRRNLLQPVPAMDPAERESLPIAHLRQRFLRNLFRTGNHRQPH